MPSKRLYRESMEETLAYQLCDHVQGNVIRVVYNVCQNLLTGKNHEFLNKLFYILICTHENSQLFCNKVI